MKMLLQSTVGTKNIEVPGRKVRCNDTNGIVTAVGNGDDYTAATQYNCVKLKGERERIAHVWRDPACET